MAIYNFNISEYFNGYNHIKILIKYRRTLSKLTKVKVADDLDIPFTTYRRLEDDPNYKNEAQIHKVAEFFDINYKVTNNLIEKINNDFNSFYNYTYFGDISNQAKLYNDLMKYYDECKNNILEITLDITKLIYILSNAQFTKNESIIEELIEKLDYFYDCMTTAHKIIYNSYICGYYSYKKDERRIEKIIAITLKLTKNDEVLTTVFYYQLSMYYFLLNKWHKSLYFAIQAKDKLEDTNNFNRLIYVKYNMAMILYKILSYDESIRILNKIINWIPTVNNERLEYNSLLLMVYCNIRINCLHDVRVSLMDLIEKNSNKGELIMLLLYIYCRLNLQKEASEYFEVIKDKYLNETLYEGYYLASLAVYYMYTGKRSEEVNKVYQKSIIKLPNYCNFYDILVEEVTAYNSK